MTACAPPKENCTTPSEDCAPKKLTGLGLLKCTSRPKTPILVFSAGIFVIFCGLTPDFIKLLGRRPFFGGVSSLKNS